MAMVGIEHCSDEWLVLADSYHQQLADVEEGTSHALLVLQAAHISARIVNLTEAFVDLVNNDHVLAAPPVARALYETCCIPCYMVLEVLPRIKKESNEALRLIYRLGLGGSNEVGFRIRPITIKALHKAMRRRLGIHIANFDDAPTVLADDIGRYLYGELSDRTHPNFGAFLHNLAPDGEGARLQSLIRPVFTDENIAGLLTSVSIVLIVAERALEETLEMSAKHPIRLSGGPAWQDGDRY